MRGFIWTASLTKKTAKDVVEKEVNMDKITEQGKHYQDGLSEAFAALSDAPEFAAGTRELWEDGMREYLADPIEPLRKRYKKFLKRLHRRYPIDKGTADVLVSEIEGCLKIVVDCRAKLLETAEKAGIKLKKRIVV